MTDDFVPAEDPISDPPSVDRRPTKHRRGFDSVVLYDTADNYAPPERPVLELSVIGDTTFLTIRRMDETYSESKLTTVTQIAVDTYSLQQALQASMNADQMTAVPRDGLTVKVETRR